MSEITKKKTITRQIGSVLKRKDNDKQFYIKLSEPVEFVVKDKSGTRKVTTQFLNLDDPRESIKRLAEKGYITEDAAQERLEKLPSYVKYELNVSINQD